MYYNHSVPAILLDGTPFVPDSSMFPCMIHGAHKSGASFFSIAYIATLLTQKKKCIFYTAFPMAKEAILSMLPDDTFILVTDDTDLTTIPPEKSLLLESGNQNLLQKVMTTLKNPDDYIVFIKNIEDLALSVFGAIRNHPLLILSGSIDLCPYSEVLNQIERGSTILFSPLSYLADEPLPVLAKYEGYLTSKTMNGVITIAS